MAISPLFRRQVRKDYLTYVLVVKAVVENSDEWTAQPVEDALASLCESNEN